MPEDSSVVITTALLIVNDPANSYPQGFNVNVRPGDDYKVVNNGGKWKVYDVVVENIGLVANYRNEFAGIIRKEQFSGLLTRLKAKTAANTAG